MNQTEKLSSLINISDIGKIKELKDKIIFAVLALIVYRIGAHIPIPGINHFALEQFANANSSGILGMFNMLSGGSLGRMSIFALAIMPYITASIIMQLLTVLSKTVDNIKKEGESGRKKISQYTRYLTVILASFQAFGIAVGLENMFAENIPVVNTPGFFFRLATVITLVGGTIYLMWLGEQITQRGIGNGTSLIIFASIVSGLPNALATTFELGRTGSLSPLIIVLIIIIAVFLLYSIVFMERSFRKIIIQYPKRQMGNMVYAGETSHLPIKLNSAGVIPPIFASSLLLFPLTVANFMQSNSKDIGMLQDLIMYLGHGKPLYIVLYTLLIVFFCFFYTAIVFNPQETAENLKKNGAFIPGRRPGKSTAEYLDYVLVRLTVIGAAYIAFVCIIPEILISNYSIPFYLGGTSILIVVNVVIDLMTQIQTHLFAHRYENLIKKAKIKGKIK